MCRDRGSNTGPSDLQSDALPTELSQLLFVVEEKKSGGAGYRSLCLMHAKHALYHLSYTPTQVGVQNFLVSICFSVFF